MDKGTLKEYLQLYTEDFERAVDRFYTDDIVFENPDDIFRGKQAILDHFQVARDGIREIFTPLNILIEEDRIAVEMDVELLATKDKPDFPAKPLRVGESIRRKVAAFYWVRDGKICSVAVYRSGDRPA